MLAFAAALLILIGLLTGIFVGAAMGQRIPADPHNALASHLNALLGAFWMFAVAWTLPMLSYGAVGQKRLAWAVTFPNYANWLITAIKAFLHVSGVDVSRDSANNGVFVALTLLVVLPSLGASGAWLWGFRRRTAE